MKINLTELAAAMAQSDVRQSYVDVVKGKVVLLADDLNEEDMLEHVLRIEDDWERYIPLPNVMDESIHDLMYGFAESCPRKDTRHRLLNALSGEGAASRFRYQVRRLLLKSAWDTYLKSRLLDFARDWCEENALEYEPTVAVSKNGNPADQQSE